MPLFCDGEVCLRNIPGVVPGEGNGFYIVLINKTGSASVKGTLVKAGSVDDRSFGISGTDELNSIGVVLDDGIPDGGFCRVIVSGIAQVLLQDGTTATRGYWASTSTVPGRALCTTPNAPGVILNHFEEIGHCLETVTAGVGKLAWCDLHFN